MCLCEINHVVLRVGRPYIFIEGQDCPKCQVLADQARQAYGPDGGRARLGEETRPRQGDEVGESPIDIWRVTEFPSNRTYTLHRKELAQLTLDAGGCTVEALTLN